MSLDREDPELLGFAAAAPVDDAARQELDAEARDAANRALENARDEQK